MKHDKQSGSGKSWFNRLCIGACAIPVVGLAFIYRDSASLWLPAALMLVVCGGAHFLMRRGTRGGERSPVKQGEEGVSAAQAGNPAPDSEVVATKYGAPLTEKQTRNAV